MTQIERATSPRPKFLVRTTPRVHIYKTRAPFSLRCGAILIDYITLVSILAISTLFARTLGGGARTAGSSTETIGIIIAVIFAALNFAVLPGLWGQSVGKWATGLRIERCNGGGLSIGRACLRSFVGYPLSLLTLGLGFLAAALNARGRTLQDLIADTVVVREEIVRLER